MRLTKREASLAMLSNAPLEMDVVIPPPRKRQADGIYEWRELQMPCVKETRTRMKLDRNLRFIAAGAAQNRLTPQQAGFAKAMGWERGIADIILFYNAPLKIHVVELKLPGKPLSEEQTGWFSWWMKAGVQCSRVETVRQFCIVLDSFCGG